MKTLALYAKVFGIGLQDTFVYRWNFVLRCGFTLVPLLGTVFVWRSVCEANGRVGDYSYSSMVFYFLAVLLVESLASPTEDEWRIAAEIREGQISALLTKPLDYLLYRFTLFASYRLLYTLLTLPLVACVLYGFREHLRWPEHALTWALFALSVAGSALIQFFVAFSLAMLAFWILEVSTLIFILYSFEYFLSGHVFPLDLLSPTLAAFVAWTPFPYELFFPIQILLERLSPEKLAEGFCIQFAWVFLSGMTAATLWKRGVRRYQAAGA
ncbi:MAG: hypothetical protein RLZZ142_2741 [Verrucomicrobiota bacterium]